MSLFIEQQFSPSREFLRHAMADYFLCVRRLLAGWPRAEAMNGGFLKFVPPSPSWQFSVTPTAMALPGIGAAIAALGISRRLRVELLKLFRNDDEARRHQRHRAYMHRRSRYLKGHRYPPKAWA